MKNLNIEIPKIDFVLATVAIEFFSCGAYNEFYYRKVVSKEFTLGLMEALMFAVTALTLFVLMRSNICRTMNMAIATGLLPAITVMYAAYFSKYTFQIVSTWLICILSIIRTCISLYKAGDLQQVQKKILLIRYAIMLTSTMGIIAFMFIAMT